MLNQRLRHTRVHMIVRHVIADPIGTPTQGKFTEITRAHHKRTLLIGESEQEARSLSRLDVLECGVIHRFPSRLRMADVLEHLLSTWSNVDGLIGTAGCAHDPPGLVQRPLARGKSRQSVAKYIGAWETQNVHRLCANDDRLRRIQSSGYADHDLVDAGRLQSLHQSLHLDLVHLTTALVSLVRVARNIGEALV